MTTQYNGTNIGLEYDAEAGTWGFKNIAQNFIDTNTFSTADPSFEYAPVPPADDTEPEQDPCPPGYVYDETLKQCVPDPNYQNLKVEVIMIFQIQIKYLLMQQKKIGLQMLIQ